MMSDTRAFDQVYAALEAQRPEPFKPCSWYNTDGDSLEVYLSPDPHIAERINTLISVFVCPKDRTRILGFVIKNIKRHFGEAGLSQVTYAVQRATVRLILLSAMTAFELGFVRKGVHPEGSTKLGDRRIGALMDELGDAEVEMTNPKELAESR